MPTLLLPIESTYRIAVIDANQSTEHQAVFTTLDAANNTTNDTTNVEAVSTTLCTAIKYSYQPTICAPIRAANCSALVVPNWSTDQLADHSTESATFLSSNIAAILFSKYPTIVSTNLAAYISAVDSTIVDTNGTTLVGAIEPAECPTLSRPHRTTNILANHSAFPTTNGPSIFAANLLPIERSVITAQ